MPRATKDARLDTAAARSRLAVRKKPHYRLIERGLHVGYYRGAKGGSWIARRYVGAGAYETERIGLADDGRASHGKHVLTFAQAQAKARHWATAQAKHEAGTDDAAAWTVADAMRHYLDDYSARGGKALRDVEITIGAHIFPKLGELNLSELTPKQVRGWHNGLAIAPPRLRTGSHADKRRVRVLAADDMDARRARRATANRILTVLKAALNLVFRDGHAPSADPWMLVKPFPKVDAPKVRYLNDDETARLVNACPADLRRLVTGAILTGCRYGELAKLRPSDVDIAAGVLTVQGKGDGVRHVVLTDEARRFFEQQMAGKLSGRPFLLREGGGRWGRSHQFRPLREACAAAGISPPVSFHILRHTHASRLAQKGVPMAVIAAQLGHSDIKLTQKHYAHLSPGYVAETIRAGFGSLGVVQETNVTPVRPAERVVT